jgi:hypothetical protein
MSDKELATKMYLAVQRTCFGSDGNRLARDVATDGMLAALAVVKEEMDFRFRLHGTVEEPK